MSPQRPKKASNGHDDVSSIRLDSRLSVDRRTAKDTFRFLKEKKRMDEYPPNDYGMIDVHTEAAEGCNLRIGEFFFELCVHMLYPLSIPLVGLWKGRLGLEMHSWLPAGMGHKGVRKVSGGPLGFAALNFAASGIPACLLWFSVLCFLMGYIPRNSPALIDLIIGFVFHFFSCAVRAFKYGYRARSAKLRLIDHVARRHEELLRGWLFLPDDWTVFLIRLAAASVDLPLDAVVLLEDPGHAQRAPREEVEASIALVGKDKRGIDWIHVDVDEECDDSIAREHGEARGAKVQIADVDDIIDVEARENEDADCILPNLEHTKRIAPDLIECVRIREDGLIEVPIKALLLELIIPLGCASSQDLGLVMRVLWRSVPIPMIVIMTLPTVLRVAFLHNFSELRLSGLEIMTMIGSAFTLMIGMAFLCRVLLVTALVFKRRLTLQFALAKLLDGTKSGFDPLRIATRVDQAQQWDHLRKLILCFGENFAKRAVASLALVMIFVVMAKVFVLMMLAYCLVSGTQWAVRQEPVVPGILIALPFVYAPYILGTIYWGAEINEVEKERLLQSLNLRMRQVIRARAQNLDGDDQTTEKLRQDKLFECVQQTFDLVAKSIITQQRKVVLLGWGNANGKGLFQLSYGMMLQYVFECVLHVAFLARCVNFAPPIGDEHEVI